MLNPEESHSQYFEELCALWASGQVSEEEFVTLRGHVAQCAQCQSLYAEFHDLIHDKVPLVHPELKRASVLPRLFSRNLSYRKRFIARARKQGLEFSGEALGSSAWYGVQPAHFRRFFCISAVAAMIVFLFAVVGILAHNLRQSNARYATLAADLSKMRRQIDEQTLAQVRRSQPASVRSPSPPSLLGSSGAATNLELIKTRQAYADAQTRVEALEHQLRETTAELQGTESRLEDANSSRQQLTSKLAESEQSIVRTGDELQRLRRGRSDDAETITAQMMKIRELSVQVGGQTEALERERDLLAAGRDIHDLMGARNLHIVDVLDVDSKGNDGRAFGRVFYTEGKSLIFYAFDLGDRNTAKRNASFQVWGVRGAAQNPSKSLGIFYVDDQKQNRWVLKFEDPKTLAEIDSVFVTVEPPGGSAKPTGQKLLYAYLKANPNHP